MILQAALNVLPISLYTIILAFFAAFETAFIVLLLMFVKIAVEISPIPLIQLPINQSVSATALSI